MKRPTRTRRLLPGDPAPWFRAPAVGGIPEYDVSTVAGRWVVMLFFDSAERGAVRAALRTVAARRAVLDDVTACFFGVTADPQDVAQARIAPDLPGIRFLLDADRAVSRAYGAAAPDTDQYDSHWLLLDPALQVAATFPLEAGDAAFAFLRARLDVPPADDAWAPVLLVPDVFEPPVCRQLIGLYDQAGGSESGFMHQADGRTMLAFDHAMKRRRDHLIVDEGVRRGLAARIERRLKPRIARAFQFDVTRIERYVVACYDAAAGGHFRAHRDNTTAGTAHRRFAVTINLNDDYDGGDLTFPEYGLRTYRAPPGGAIVFSCSLLHEARPVTAGRRYAFLPFLYDEAAARQREANNAALGEGVAAYRADPAAA